MQNPLDEVKLIKENPIVSKFLLFDYFDNF